MTRLTTLSLLLLTLLLLLTPLATPTPQRSSTPSSQNLVTNGDFSDGVRGWFDRDDRPLPATPSRAPVALDPRGGLDRGPGLRLDARGRSYKLTASSSPFKFNKGRRYRLSFMARVPGDETAQFSAQIQWVARGSRVRGGPPSRNTHVISKEWREYGYDFDVPPNISQARVSLSAPSERVGFIDDVRVVEIAQDLQILSFAPTDAVSRFGEPLELVCTVVNRGGSEVPSVVGKLSIAGRKRVVEVGDLGPGEVRQVALDASGLEPGIHSTELSLRGRLGAPARSATDLIVFDPSADDAIHLQSGPARLTFHKAGDAHAVIVLEHQVGESWRPLGVLPGLARLRVAGDVADAWLAGQVTVTDDQAQAVVTQSGIRCDLLWRATGDGWFEVHSELKALRSVDLVRFVSPELHAGWGAGGRSKHSAVFGGLEFLDAEQVSSGTEAVLLELSQRFVPHPYEVAMPIMAVAHEGIALGVSWDPEQSWDGRRRMPSSLFASPNRWTRQDDHLLAIFLPSVPEFVQPGEDRARRPYSLRRGQKLTLEAELFVLPVEAGVEETLAAWYRRHGARESEADWSAARKQAAASMLASFDERVSGWPYAGEDPPGFFAEVAQTLLSFGLDERGPLARRALDQVDASVAAAVRRGETRRMGIELALHVGHVAENLAASSGSLSRTRKQRADGSWGYEVEGGPNNKARLGAAGTAALGISADHIEPLLDYARASGNLRALRAATKGLAFTESLRVPYGSQTWEVPILAPDLLSVEEGIDLQVTAYELTGNQRHLREALRWAHTGLAFISTWEDDDRPGQRYASTAVFGGSYFGAPWWGRPVQWIGLVYAGAILRLAPHDPDFPWRRIAEGLIASGLEQKALGEDPRAHNPWPGSYADFYRLKDKLVLGKWIGPWTLVRQLNHLAGRPATTMRRLTVRGSRDVFVTSAAQIQSCSLQEERLEALLEYLPSRAPHTLVAPIDPPAAVEIGGRPLDRADDLDLVKEGWTYVREQRVLIIKHPFAKGTLDLTVEGVRGEARGRR